MKIKENIVVESFEARQKKAKQGARIVHSGVTLSREELSELLDIYMVLKKPKPRLRLLD